jgi:hypothetical protein
MYSDDVENGIGSIYKYDNNKRFENARKYLEQLEASKSLIFYYVGYSKGV